MKDPSDHDYLDNDDEPAQVTEDEIKDYASLTEEQKDARIEAQLAAHDQESKDWLEREILRSEREVKYRLASFQSSKLTPAESEDFKRIELAVSRVMDNQSWVALDPVIAQTARGRQFLNRLNETIQRVQSRAEMMQISLPL